MALITKIIKGRKYYYFFLSYRRVTGPKSFSKYIGVARPSVKDLAQVEETFKQELIKKLSGKRYSNEATSKDDVIKSLLFCKEFTQEFQKLTESKRRKYDIDSTVRFTLTTLTTEEVDVGISDVEAALTKRFGLTQREQISRNMLRAVDSIKGHHKLDKTYLLDLHRLIMATFETKTPGRFRTKRVHLYRYDVSETAGKRELRYQPPHHAKVIKLLDAFVKWYNESTLNPIEKAAVAHYSLYKIHPFLDGNKRICRLVLNKALLDNGFPLINISVNKEPYFDALVASVESGDPKVFIDFTIKEFYSQIKEFLIQEKLDKIDDGISSGTRRVLSAKDALGDYAKHVK